MGVPQSNGDTQSKKSYSGQIDNDCDKLLNEWNLLEISKILHDAHWDKPDDWAQIMNEHILIWEVGLTRDQARLFISKYKELFQYTTTKNHYESVKNQRKVILIIFADKNKWKTQLILWLILDLQNVFISML